MHGDSKAGLARPVDEQRYDTLFWMRRMTSSAWNGNGCQQKPRIDSLPSLSTASLDSGGRAEGHRQRRWRNARTPSTSTFHSARLKSEASASPWLAICTPKNAGVGAPIAK